MISFLRGVLATLGVVVLLGGVACGSSAAPAPTTSPTASTTSPAAQPAGSPAASPEWENTVAAAKKEGKVTVAGHAGDAYREAMMVFQKAYPDIKLEITGLSGSQFAPKAIAEREAGQFLWDVYMGGAGTALRTLTPNKVIEPLKPALLSPDVLDNSKWMGGLDDGWMDVAGQYVYGFEAGFMPSVLVNRSAVPESELNSMDQLLDPKWKGKIVTGDIRASGGVPSGTIALFLGVKGEEWTRKFLSQDLVLMAEERAVVESVVRGRYPIMLMVSPASFAEFRTPELQSMIANIKPVDIDGAAGATIDTGTGNITLVNRAPHPNAAKVFINWVLSQEGQKSYADKLFLNSRRTDVEPRGEYKPKPNLTYQNVTREHYAEKRDQTAALVKEMIK